MVSATAAACVLARARLETGSIWPCIVLHFGLQQRDQSAFWPAAPGSGAFIWVGMEAGILVAVVLVLLALALCRGRWTFLSHAGPADVSPCSTLSSGTASSSGRDRLPGRDVEPVPDVDRGDRQHAAPPSSCSS